MTREQILATLKLLSALEAWSFSNNQRLPEFLLEKLNDVVDVLTKEILK